MAQKISEADLLLRLSDLPDWQLLEGKLHRSLQFKSFVQAFAFMTAAALEAEKMDHHPDWFNSYSRVDIYLQTHDVQGITESDVALAKKFDVLVALLLQKN